LKGRKKLWLQNGILLKNMQVKRKGSNGKWIMDPKCMHVKNEISYV
jgi:predicted CoA-binding protein